MYQNFSLLHVTMRMHFLNKLPEYVLAIQLVQERGSRLCSRSCTFWITFPNMQSLVVLLCGEVDLKRDLASS